MTAPDRVRARLDAAVEGGDRGLSVADRLCHACVEVLDVDGAAISVVDAGVTRGTFGSSGDFGQSIDELQFTLGEGPCLDAVRWDRPILVPDLEGPGGRRWPAFTAAAVDSGVRAVFALPVTIASEPVAALDLFSRMSGVLGADVLDGGLRAAELAALPLLDLMTAEVDWQSAVEGGDGWGELGSLERVEVYQATGMIMAQLDVGPAEALVRLRAQAFADGVSTSEVAWAVVERRLALGADQRPPSGPAAGAAAATPDPDA